MDPLVAELRSGSEVAFTRTWEDYRPRVFVFLLRLSGRGDVAEELTQECFLRLARNARRLAPDTRLKSWLFVVARNLWLSHRRWAWVDGDRLIELAARALSAPEPPSALELAALSQAQRAIERAIAAMPVSAREVFLLVAGEGMEPGEAAQILGIKPDAARQRLARARRVLETMRP